MLARKALAGTAGAPKVFVEDVMSCFLYTGNGSTQTITNNIDLSGEGGLVWIKQRDGTANHTLTDTARGTDFQLASNSNVAQSNVTTRVTAFNTTGFNLGASSAVNGSPNTYASWTFRKAEKFFDVVTFTQSGTSGYQTINHNLGSVPGVIIIKGVGQADGWFVYHRSIPTQVTYLNQTNAAANFTLSNSVTSTTFNFNLTDFGFGNGATYVAYLFAHDAGGFGDAGSDNVISCGSFNATSAGSVSLGYEPQWVMFKQSNGASDWYMTDNMRGFATGTSTNQPMLLANTSAAESNVTGVSPTATGFDYSALGGTWIYIAIRRGPMKTPTTGTSVFGDTYASVEPVSTNLTTESGVLADLVVHGLRISGTSFGRHWMSRLTGDGNYLVSSSTNAEVFQSNFWKFDNNNYAYIPPSGYANNSGTGTPYVAYSFKRAPKFFDVVCWTATGSAQTLSHNLQAVPELMIRKRRDDATGGQWDVYAAPLGATNIVQLNNTSAVDANTAWDNTTPTSSVVYMNNTVNGWKYVTYLFASLSGVSKVGSYTGNGSSVTVTTNFQPRFILVKRTDSTGDWIVSDSARGLVAGNDPYLELNTTDAEVTNEDWVDISSTSFTVNQTTNNANVNTGTYIYLAIA